MATASKEHISFRRRQEARERRECVYFPRERESFCILGVHVDDIFPLYNREGEKIKERILRKLRETMEVEDKGEIKHALDTHTQRDTTKRQLRISQTAYIENILREFHIERTAHRTRTAERAE